MTSLVVVAHPDRHSRTQRAARAAYEAIQEGGGGVEFADLAAEGFDPRFTDDDLDRYRGGAPAPAAVIAEQERLDRADHLVLVFPMYWWSMPALLKGWIDRIFVDKWAFDLTAPGGQFGLLGHLTIDLIIVAGDDSESFERHGIPGAVRTQIERGIIEYCGATHGSTHYVLESETKETAVLDAELRELGAAIATHVVELTRLASSA